VVFAGVLTEFRGFSSEGAIVVSRVVCFMILSPSSDPVVVFCSNLFLGNGRSARVISSLPGEARARFKKK
jgi:hypothetical protein